METRSNYAIVGAVVVALVIAMFIGVIWLARFSGSDDQHFDIFFKQSINGLAVGSPVAPYAICVSWPCVTTKS